MASVFTKIINREIPGHIVYEDDKFIALLDINPIRDGHILVVPKKEVDYIFDLDDHEYLDLMQVSKKVALFLESKIKGKINFSRIAIIVEGLQVPHVHVHVHLIPLHESEGLVIGRKTNLSLDEVKNIILN
ncbi:MAG: HIT family protein [Candidatus Paceibacterota bacterium]|jgi:histidine triad (HIT) family protein